MSSSAPVKPSQIPRACRRPVTPRQGGLRPSASQERLRHDNESLSVPKHRTSRSSPVKKKAPSPAQVPTRNAVCTGGSSKVDNSVSTYKTPSKLPQPSPKPHPQDDIFKKPQIRPWSPQQEQRPNSPTKQFQTIHEESASDNQQLTSEHLTSEFKDTPISRRSRPSLSERTIETISQIPPSPSPRRRKSSFYSTESPMRPPSRPASAMSNGIERMSNFGSSRRVSGLDSGLASSGEGHSSHKSSAQSSVYHTPARRSTSRTSSQSTSSSLKANLSAEGMTLTIPELTSNHQRNPNTSGTRATGLAIPRLSMQEIRANGRNLLPGDRKSEDEYTSPFQPEDFSRTSLGGSTPFSKALIYSKPSKLTSQSSSHLDTQREPTDDSCLDFPTTGLASRSSSRGKSARLEMPSEIFKSIPGQRSFSSSSGPFRGIIAAARAAWPIRKISLSDGGAPKQATTRDSQICLDNSYDSVWQLRLLESMKTAMKTGRMDISGLWLTQIPNPIARLYGVALVEDSGPFPNEEIDISNFIAARNRLKAIPDEAFPDTPAWKRVGRRGSCFHNLMFLDMHHNQLERLPMGLRRLESLAKLDLHHNKLTTSSLEVIVQILSLCDLNLAMNRLRGRLPLAISNLKNLVTLDLHGNSLDHLPKDIGKLLHLRTLDLSDNRFEQLPYEVFGTLCLVRLSVARNLLEGALLPPGITKMPYLEELDVSHNLLTSLRTESLRPVPCPALRGLDFSMNSISTLPVTRDWPHLASLNASDNAIGPRLHVEHIAMCDNLLQADFSGNEIYYVEGRAHGIESMSFLSLDRNPKSRLFKLGFELYETKEAYLRKRTLTELPESLSRTEVAWGSFGGAPIPNNAHTAQQGAQRSMRNVSRESEVFPPLTINMDYMGQGSSADTRPRIPSSNPSDEIEAAQGRARPPMKNVSRESEVFQPLTTDADHTDLSHFAPRIYTRISDLKDGNAESRDPFTQARVDSPGLGGPNVLEWRRGTQQAELMKELVAAKRDGEPIEADIADEEHFGIDQLGGAPETPEETSFF